MPSAAWPNSLIHTKLNRPRIAAELIERARLYATLDRRRPLTVVVAPAGYGKTTLVSSWCERGEMRCAWLALDSSNSHLASFLDYLLAAVDRLFPQVVSEIGLRPYHGTTISFAATARKLADALDAIDETFLLVLDDYHHVSDPAIHRFLSEFLRYPPHSINLVIASRVDPPLPLAALRAHDQLTEVRTFDLRFTRNETADYLNGELEEVLDPKTLTILDESIEGWIAGLHLAALFLRNEKDIPAAAQQFAQGNRFALDYLTTEVLAKQDADIQSFLVKTSLLTRMCPELCDALLGVAPGLQHSRRILDQLESAEVFISTLDGQGQWFRYHQLFQHFLRHRLHASHTPLEVAALYAAACAWCSAQELIDEAIPYALAGGNVREVVRLTEVHRHAAMDAEQWRQLEARLGLLPRRIIDSFPQLLILEAWILHTYERLAEIPERLDRAEALLVASDLAEDERVRLSSEIDALRSQLFFWRGDAALSLRTARSALEHAPPEHANVRGLAWMFAGASTFLLTGMHNALDSLRAAAAEDPMQRTLVSARTLTVKCLICWMGADMHGLKAAAEELVQLAARRQWQESLVWGRYFLGCANYELNHLPAAADDFAIVMDWRHGAPGFAFIQGAFGLASVLQAQSKPEAAHAVVESVLEHTFETGDRSGRINAQAFQAHLALAQNNFDAALRWLSGADRTFQPAPIPTFYAPILTAAAVLIRTGAPAGLNEAEQLLRNLGAFLPAVHIVRFQIEALLLQTQLFTARRQVEQATAALEQAVTLAQPGGMLQVFGNGDPALDSLFVSLKLSGESGAFLRQILQMRRLGAQAPLAGGLAPKPRPTTVYVQPHHPDLIELLTHREMEVLQLLALRLTNKEIADALSISTGTVKQHTMSVFRKLHVENRREAIVQALGMGFRLTTLQS